MITSNKWYFVMASYILYYMDNNSTRTKKRVNEWVLHIYRTLRFIAITKKEVKRDGMREDENTSRRDKTSDIH